MQLTVSLSSLIYSVPLMVAPGDLPHPTSFGDTSRATQRRHHIWSVKCNLASFCIFTPIIYELTCVHTTDFTTPQPYARNHKK